MDENLYDDNDMQTEEPEEEETSSLTVEELRFLCDATRSADFMPKQMADALCRKLINMADPSEKKYLLRHSRYGNRRNHHNAEVMQSLDYICLAICEGKKVSFEYFTLNYNRERIYHDLRQEINPYGVVFHNGYYYMCGYSESKKSNAVYRIDRMTNTMVSDVDAIKADGRYKFKERDLQRLMTGNDLCEGTEKHITLRVNADVLSELFDKFGEQTEVYPDEDDCFIVNELVVVSEPFYSWVAKFGSKMQILSPQSAVDGMKRFLENALSNYQ